MNQRLAARDRGLVPKEKENGTSEENYRLREVADRGRQGNARAPSWPRAGPGASQHYGVLQAIQREDAEQGDGRADYSGRHHGLWRPHLQLYYQDAAGGGAAEEGGGHREGIGHAQQGKDG